MLGRGVKNDNPAVVPSKRPNWNFLSLIPFNPKIPRREFYFKIKAL
jgi:hypothetical protein